MTTHHVIYTKKVTVPYADPFGHWPAPPGTLLDEMMELIGSTMAETLVGDSPTEPEQSWYVPTPVAPVTDAPPVVVPLVTAEVLLQVFEQWGDDLELEIFLSYLAAAEPGSTIEQLWHSCQDTGNDCDVPIGVWRVTDKDWFEKQPENSDGGQFGMFWTPVPIDYWERYWGDGPDYSGAMDALALPPQNPYNVIIVGWIEVGDLPSPPRWVSERNWPDGTTARGGGVELIIPGGCRVVSCIWHEYEDIWPR